MTWSRAHRPPFGVLALLLALAALPWRASVRAQAGGVPIGPAPPPDFYGALPDPFPERNAPEGVKRAAIHYTGTIVGEIEPCG